MTDRIYLGGTANVVYISQTEGIAAMTGSFRGGAYARVTSDRQDMGDGRTEFDMEHFFVHEDGSVIKTRDRSFVQETNGEITAGGTDYTVIEATGRFEGMRGTFHSRGGWLFEKGVGVLRFEGEIGR